MKYFSVFFSLLFVALSSIVTIAQTWFTQHAPGLPNSVNPQIIFSAVDSNVCWGINVNNSQYIRTTDGGTNWSVDTITSASGLNGSCISALDAYTSYAAMNDPSGTTSGGIFKTTNGGASWTKQTSAFPGSGGYPANIHFFDFTNGVVIGNPNNGSWEIYTTTDGGEQWTQVPPAGIPIPPMGFVGNGLFASFNNYIWFGTEGPLPTSHWIYRSTNKGLTWFGWPNPTAFCLAFKDSLNGIGVHLGYHISRTTDGGVTWMPLQNRPASFIKFISYIKGTMGAYIVTSDNDFGYPVIRGSSYTDDDGLTWKYLDSVPHGRASFSDWNTGWSSGVNDSIYKWIGLPTDVKENLFTNHNFQMFQNYPNPFNPSTTISWQSPVGSWQTLKVYDLLGNEVATLVDEYKPAGSYEIEFNAAELSSGIYFYTLQAGGFTQTKKLILIK